MILLDTHVWIWFHVDSKKLSPRLSAELSNSKTRLAISAVSIWETMIAMQRGRIETSVTPETAVQSWLRESPFEVIPLGSEIALLSRTLQFKHDDPADRFIAATAYQLKSRLATVDVHLLDLPWLETLS